MKKSKHEHKWGPWLHPDKDRIDWFRLHVYRFCVDGWCSKGQYKNGRLFEARPERKVKA